MSWTEGCCCKGCNNYSKPKEKPTQQDKLEKQRMNDEVEQLSPEDVLARFENLCGTILMGKANENENERITKAMVRTGQQNYMASEFKRIGKLLEG